MGFEIICADTLSTLKGMADKSVDICVTSPPYNQLGSRISKKGIGAGSGMMQGNAWLRKAQSIGYGDDKPEPEYQAWLREIVGECLRVCRGLVWINHKNRYRNKVGIHPLSFLPFPMNQEIIWDRNGTFAFNCRKFAPCHEHIFGFGEPHFWDRKNDTKMSVWRIPPARGIKGHPCPFPVEIPKRLIESSCPHDGRVLDPFCGSGTTGVAAMLTGREFIGIDNVPKYCELARERIGQAVGVDFEGLQLPTSV
jgi:modification methylase